MFGIEMVLKPTIRLVTDDGVVVSNEAAAASMSCLGDSGVVASGRVVLNNSLRLCTIELVRFKCNRFSSKAEKKLLNLDEILE